MRRRPRAGGGGGVGRFEGGRKGGGGGRQQMEAGYNGVGQMQPQRAADMRARTHTHTCTPARTHLQKNKRSEH